MMAARYFERSVPYCVLSHPRRGNILAPASDANSPEDEADCRGICPYKIRRTGREHNKLQRLSENDCLNYVTYTY